MKIYSILLLFGILLFGCNTSKKDTVKENAVAETPVAKEAFISKNSLPVVDYEGLLPYLSKNDSKTYIVNFWATWCKPCIKELPYFEKLGAAYKEQEVEVLLVSLDNPKVIEKQVIPFIKKTQLQSEVIVFDDADANSWIPKIAEEWSGAIPATLFYNKNNRKFFEKSFTYEELEAELKSIL